MHHIARNAPRLTFSRLFATLPSRPLKTRQFIESFYKDSHDPVWRLLNNLTTSGRHELQLSDALRKSDVSQQDIDRWNPILSRADIEGVVSQLQGLGYRVEERQRGGEQIPTWIVLYLVGYKVRTPAHAKGALLDLVYSNLDSLPPPTHGPVLILTALNLSRFNLLLPLRRVIDSFLTTAHFDDPESQFNLFLQALAYTPYRSVESANNVVNILRAMESRQLKLRSHTYEALLNDRFVTLQLTKFLHTRMVQEGFVPTADHLEAYLRIFAKNGAIHDAQQYFEMIHSAETDKDSRYRANTTFLNAQEKRTSAFAFLQALTSKHDTVKSQEAVPPAPRFVHRTKSSIYDQTAALHVASKDFSTSTRVLINTFMGISKPTIATYTVLIHGLLLRKEFAKAETFWTKMANQSGFTLDNHALTAGLEALTRNGKPHVAFQMLEKYASPSLAMPISLTTISLNEYLVSLKRIARPDIVLRLFTYMPTLYSVHPNAQSLSILLQSARLACRMDDTLPGVLHTLVGKINPFRRYKVYNKGQAREKAVDELLSALGHPSRGGLRRYMSGNWMGESPAEFARGVFLRIVWGMDAETAGGGVLKDIESPASAFRQSYDSDAASSGLGLSLGPELTRLGPKKYVFEPPPDLLTADNKSWYPTIIPTNACFFNYFTLLGISGRVNEVPLTLAWMRTLGIQPSKATLGVALVLWAEVSVQAPLVERWYGKAENEEYGKLVDWCRDWVGEQRLPHWKTLGKWQEVVRKMRSSSGDEEEEEMEFARKDDGGKRTRR